MSNITYTTSEQTEKNYTVGQAVSAARIRLGNIPMCMNAISRKHWSPKEPITLAALNDLADEIVDDSHFYRI